VNYTKSSSGSEFRPVNGLTQPLEVVAEESVDSGARVHESVREGDCSMEDGVAGLEAVANLVENVFVCVAVAEEELKVQLDASGATQDVAY
jgi:hypothetical protein